MILILKLIGAALLGAVVFCGVAIYDIGWNGGALFYRLAGRDALVKACLPSLKENLAGRGFTPVDLDFANSPSIAAFSGSLGGSKSLADSFSFSDGQNGPRVDGHMVCTVSGTSVAVEVEVDTLPRRVT